YQADDPLSLASFPTRRSSDLRYYNGFANEALWPLFHYMPTRFRFRHEDYDAYEAVNRIFAQKLVPLIKPGDAIWVHDYHLVPLARLLREHGVRAPRSEERRVGK